jgi:DNA-binding transcriptional LysR family regulator
MLDTRSLRYFIAVAEDLHFGRAADRLHVAQSAVSFQIKKLEDHFGTPLLRRSKRANVELTEAGRLFLVEAQSALRQLERAERIGTLAGRGEAGHVELGYVASAAPTGILPSFLDTFRTRHPDVRLHVTLMETPRQIAALADGRLDIGLIRPRPHYPDGVQAQIVHREGLCVALARDHPLASRACLSAADLKDETFLIPHFDENAGFGASLTRLADTGGFTVGAAQRLSDFVTALCLAAGGYGVVLGPESMRQHGIDKLVFQPIRNFDEEVELALAFRSGATSPAARAFVRAALESSTLNQPL